MRTVANFVQPLDLVSQLFQKRNGRVRSLLGRVIVQFDDHGRMKSSQSLNCTSEDSCLGAFDIHLDELDRVSGLADEIIERDRRHLEATEIVAFNGGAAKREGSSCGNSKSDLTRAVRYGFSNDRDVLNFIQAHIFFQDTEICRKRLESENHRHAGPTSLERRRE